MVSMIVKVLLRAHPEFLIPVGAFLAFMGPFILGLDSEGRCICMNSCVTCTPS